MKAWLMAGFAVFLGLGIGYYLGFVSGTFLRKEPLVHVVTARLDLREGTVIHDPKALFEIEEFHRDTLQDLGPTEIDSLRGQRLARPLKVGEVCTWQHLDEPDALWANAHLESGLRAMTIRVTETSRKAVRPGMRVDVITSTTTSEGKVQSKVFLQNLLVLATDSNDMPARVVTWFVTVAVTPEQAEMLTRLARDQLFVVVARKPGDDKTVTTPGFDGTRKD